MSIIHKLDHKYDGGVRSINQDYVTPNKTNYVQNSKLHRIDLMKLNKIRHANTDHHYKSFGNNIETLRIQAPTINHQV